MRLLPKVHTCTVGRCVSDTRSYGEHTERVSPDGAPKMAGLCFLRTLMFRRQLDGS